MLEETSYPEKPRQYLLLSQSAILRSAGSALGRLSVGSVGADLHVSMERRCQTVALKCAWFLGHGTGTSVPWLLALSGGELHSPRRV